MKDRVCIFIDGENLRKSIEKMFSSKYNAYDYLPPKANWEAFFNEIIKQSAEVLSYPTGVAPYLVRSYWYVIGTLEYNSQFLEEKFNSRKTTANQKLEYFKRYAGSKAGDTSKLKSPADMGKVIDRCRAHLEEQHSIIQNRLLGWHQKQGQIEFKVPRLQFQRFGYLKTELDNLKFRGEKGVDVRLATDLILLKDIYDTAIIVSGDGDYIPAVAAIKSFGKSVVTVSFKNQDGQFLPGGARKLTSVSDTSIALQYETMREICGFNN